MTTRREFLAALASAPFAPALIGLTPKAGTQVAGGYVDDDSGPGHALRDRRLPPASRERRRTSVAIVGGGIGGLSAGWRLDALGMRDWTLLELGERCGGNARSGVNAVSRYPWGAHYLPIPDERATHVRALMRELGALDEHGEWNERMLCHSPQERIHQHGRWHEGLAPFDALPAAERAQFARFENLIAEWRATDAFAVPSIPGHERGARGPHARRLAAIDTMNASAWCREQGFTSPALRWWIEYGTRDDYGASLETASAWAAVHYFASRPAEEEGPLTWPEGNDWIASRLAARAGDRAVTRAPATRITRSPRRGAPWIVETPRMVVECDAVIWASPLFVLPYVMEGATPPVTTEYAPWVVANITLSRPPAERGAPPAWDNVIYGSPSLGYVDATHQSLGTRPDARVWTWYHAVVDREPRAARRWLADRAWVSWRDDILADLSRAHPDIARCVTRIDIMRWGHAMARPTPGVRERVDRLSRWSPAPGVFVAHADMSGMSLFEEAQWHGVRAAERAVALLGGR